MVIKKKKPPTGEFKTSFIIFSKKLNYLTLIFLSILASSSFAAGMESNEENNNNQTNTMRPVRGAITHMPAPGTLPSPPKKIPSFLKIGDLRFNIVTAENSGTISYYLKDAPMYPFIPGTQSAKDQAQRNVEYTSSDLHNAVYHYTLGVGAEKNLYTIFETAKGSFKFHITVLFYQPEGRKNQKETPFEDVFTGVKDIKYDFTYEADKNTFHGERRNDDGKGIADVNKIQLEKDLQLRYGQAEAFINALGRYYLREEGPKKASPSKSLFTQRDLENARKERAKGSEFYKAKVNGMSGDSEKEKAKWRAIHEVLNQEEALLINASKQQKR